MFVEYEGPGKGKANVCAQFSADPEHRRDPSPALYVIARDIEVVEERAGRSEVAGVTVVVHEDGTHDDERLEWTCQVIVDETAKTMRAQLLTIEPATE